MPTTTEAEEHLRVIRSLMEKATIYRAIPAPSALVGGVLAILAAFVLMAFPHGAIGIKFPYHFVAVWLLVLVLTAGANLHFLRRDAGRRGETFFSPGMRLALASLFPSFLAAGVFTVLFSLGGGDLELHLAWLWSIFYGLGLLATTPYAPRSIWYLGWAFLLAGLALLLVQAFCAPLNLSSDLCTWAAANFAMAATFGGFHLIYAACTWPRRRPVEAAAMPSTDV